MSKLAFRVLDDLDERKGRIIVIMCVQERSEVIGWPQPSIETKEKRSKVGEWGVGF